MKLEKNTKYIFWALGILLAWAFFKDSETTIESFSMFGNSAVSTTLIGIPIILLLLIPIYGIYISIKKGYNPFKMWGSWVGAVLVAILGNLNPMVVLSFGQNTLGKLVDACWMSSCTSIAGTVVLFIIGFLLGWGIHSLIRRYLK